MRTMRSRGSALVVGTAALVFAGTAGAQAGVDRKLFGGDFTFNGLVRVETAYSTGFPTHASQFGDRANGVPIHRVAGNPLTGWTTPLDPVDVNGAVGGLLGGVETLLAEQAPGLVIPSVGDVVGSISGIPGSALGGGAPPPGVSNQSPTGASDTYTRYVPARDNELNYHLLRLETNQSISWSGGWSLISRLRALYDPGDLGYRDFDARDYAHINGGYDSEVSHYYDGKPSHLGYRVDGRKQPMLFEFSGRDYMVDFPALFLQWSNGQTTVRLGNQSVAWGQLLFFRVMDVANGLDLRRHLFLDRALEEYADERMSAPGLRITHQVTDRIVADAFVHQFIPTVLNNPNTPYGLVAPQFFVHDRYHEYGYDEKLNYGIRFKGEYGNYTWQAMYTRRYNPLGAIRWTKSGVNKPLPNSNLLGAAFNQACMAALIPAYNLRYGTSLATNNGCGPLLAETAFEATPAGVTSAEEWFYYGSYTKLDGLDGLDAAIVDFPAAQQLLAQPVNGDVNAADHELDAFFIASEGLHGHIERMYFPEDIYGLGGGLVLDAEPGSFLDQMIFNLEVTLAKNRHFIPITLGHEFTERDEYQVGLVVEKYHRFSQSFPATYLVGQYLWQKESDLAGLLLDGYGSENYSDQGVVLNPNVPTSANPRITPGLSKGANYLVLAALQPTTAYVFEYSIATLIDVQGGVLIQPAVQWKPRGNVTVNLFYNYITSDAWGDNENRNLMSLIDFADEICLRVGYQF